MGAGKSIIAYLVAQYAQHDLDWLTVYIPNCMAWVSLDSSTVAQGYFLDHLAEGLSKLSASSRSTWLADSKGKFEALDVSLGKLPKTIDSWEEFGYAEADTVSTLYREAKRF